MTSLEDPTRGKERLDKPEEISTALEKGPEVQDTELEQHALSAKAAIEKEATDLTQDAERRVDSVATGMSVAPESLAQTRTEFGLDAQLAQVQIEANQLAEAAASNIVSVEKTYLRRKFLKLKNRHRKN